MPKMTGGQALAKSLIREGVKVIFGLPGVQLYHAVDAIAQEPGIRFITTRHEQATAYMADGYARASGEIGTAMVVPGPGLLNASAAIGTAFAASSPTLMVAGQVQRDLIGVERGILHEVNDQMEAIKQVTKAAYRVLDPAEIPATVHEAFRQLRTGRPRPVEIEIPPETFSDEADIDLLEPGSYGREGAPKAQVEEAARILAASKNPLIWAGGGVLSSGATDALTHLAEHLQAPVMVTPEVSQRPFSSVKARAARMSPAAMGGSSSRFWASSAPLIMAVAAKTMEEKYGAHSSARPISSITMPSSTMPNPAPPYCSGMWIPGSPSWSLSWRQISGSYPSSVSIRRRTSVAGDFSVIKRRIVVRNCSCSSVNVIWMRRARLDCDSSDTLIAFDIFPATSVETDRIMA